MTKGVEDGMGDSPKRSTREFVYDFMMLPYHEQIGLAHKFGYEGTPGPEQTDMDFFIDAMRVLKARGKIGELKVAVEEMTERRKAEGWDNRPLRAKLPAAVPEAKPELPATEPIIRDYDPPLVVTGVFKDDCEFKETPANPLSPQGEPELVPREMAHTLWYRGSRLHSELKDALVLHPEIWHGEGLQQMLNQWNEIATRYASEVILAAPKVVDYPSESPTFAYSPEMRDEVDAILNAHVPPGQRNENYERTIWPLLVELVERRRR